MFDHLDDPRPPAPSEALAQSLRAEGARRRRRRVRAAGGTAVAAFLLAGVVLRPWDADDSRVEVGPAATGSTEPEPVTTSTAVPETTTSTTEGTTTTTAAPPGNTFPEGTFAAITPDGRVVLADIETGATVLELDQLDGGIGYDLARSPDGSAVYVAASTMGLWRYAPGVEPVRIGSAFTVSVSPDGERLAAVSDGAEDFGTIRILDSTSGAVLDEISVPELTGEGDLSPWIVEWETSGRLLINANLPEAPSEIFVLETNGDLRRLGPPPGVESGTGWYLGGQTGDGEAWVLESCCARDANSVNGGRALLRIDTSTGAVLDRAPISPDWPYLVLDAGPSDEGFLILFPAYDGNEAGGMYFGYVDGTVESKAWPAFTAVDW